MNWDPFQREVLAELGHVVYRQAGTAALIDADVVLDAAMIDTPMLAQVARAAGMTADSLQGCIDDMHVIASLHGNASAKRALWPRLRALRRKHG